MNKDNIKEYWPLLEALRDGKDVQLKCGDYWENVYDLNFDLPPAGYRIKPEPKLLPWKPEEVPVGAWLKAIKPLGPALILAVDPDGLIFANALPSPTLTRISYSNALDNYLHSTDHGKTWLPCGVEE